jgi:HSP20 family molecular chaperone IbpA
MSRLTMFNSPLLLGFDHVERMLDRISKNSAEGYPPYNIEQTSEDGLRITLAVAGFSEKNLTIEVEDRQLRIHGKQLDETDRMYLHRGIASRQFIRSFVLADGIDIMGAELDNGLLHIDLMRPPVESRVQTIKIKSENPAGRKPRTVEVESD